MTPLPPEMQPGGLGGPRGVDRTGTTGRVDDGGGRVDDNGGRHHPGGLTDSAGQGWAGRMLRANPFADDDGTAPPALAAALARADETERMRAVTDALREERVLVPVVAHAHPGREAGGTVASHDRHGSDDPQGDACASAAMVSVRTPDGRAALPVFSSLETMRAWDATARPVPVEGPRAALAAVSDADSMVVLDPAGPVTVLLGRPAVWSVVQHRKWLPSWLDPELPAVAAAALRGITELLGVRLERGSRSELRALLAIAQELDREQMTAVVARAQEALAADPVLSERVDSLELYPVAVAG